MGRGDLRMQRALDSAEDHDHKRNVGRWLKIAAGVSGHCTERRRLQRTLDVRQEAERCTERELTLDSRSTIDTGARHCQTSNAGRSAGP